MPFGIIGSLVICTILYIVVAGLLTAIVPYNVLNVADPVAVGVEAIGVHWGSVLVDAGVVAGLASVMLVMLFGQSRVLYSMSSDGLLPKWASAVATVPVAGSSRRPRRMCALDRWAERKRAASRRAAANTCCVVGGTVLCSVRNMGW